MTTICAICSEAQIEFKDGLFQRTSGEPTEAALKVPCEKLGVRNTVRSDDPFIYIGKSM